MTKKVSKEAAQALAKAATKMPKARLDDMHAKLPAAHSYPADSDYLTMIEKK